VVQAGCFLNQIPTLEVQTVAFLSHPYAAGTNSCLLNQLPTLELQTELFVRKQLCFINQPLRWRYNPTLVVLTTPTSPQNFNYGNFHIHRCLKFIKGSIIFFAKKCGFAKESNFYLKTAISAVNLKLPATSSLY